MLTARVLELEQQRQEDIDHMTIQDEQNAALRRQLLLVAGELTDILTATAGDFAQWRRLTASET